MVIASHVIFSAYGFWLPNDPRGSWSEFVGSWELFRFGGSATKTEARRSLAHEQHDRNLRLAAKEVLKYPPVQFTGVQARSVGLAFGDAATQKGYVFLACSILPEHVHAVIARHERNAEDIVGHLKYAASQRLIAENIHPFQQRQFHGQPVPTMWTKRSWKVFLDGPEVVQLAIQYVQQNPVKEGKPQQHWHFVQRYVACA